MGFRYSVAMLAGDAGVVLAGDLAPAGGDQGIGMQVVWCSGIMGAVEPDIGTCCAWQQQEGAGDGTVTAQALVGMVIADLQQLPDVVATGGGAGVVGEGRNAFCGQLLRLGQGLQFVLQHENLVEGHHQLGMDINPAIKYTKSCRVGDTWMPEIRTDSLGA